MRTCVVCAASFEPTGKGYRCQPCRLAYDRAWRAERKAKGLRTGGASMPNEYHREYSRKPSARAVKAAYSRKRIRNPAERHKHEARWMARSAIAAGRLVKMPCEVCGAQKVEAHHDDYSKPLKVRWLCPPHHREHHKSKAEGV